MSRIGNVGTGVPNERIETLSDDAVLLASPCGLHGPVSVLSSCFVSILHPPVIFYYLSTHCSFWSWNSAGNLERNHFLLPLSTVFGSVTCMCHVGRFVSVVRTNTILRRAILSQLTLFCTYSSISVIFAPEYLGIYSKCVLVCHKM